LEFLRKVAAELAEKMKDPADLAIVTPNRRAGLFLKKYIQENAAQKKPVWLPQLFSIEDFISRVSELELPDPFSLVFTLYEIYGRSFDQPKPFDTFYPLSGMILSDFDEIDLSLADTKELFRDLANVSELAKPDGNPGTLMASFSHLTQNLSSLYTGFTKELLARKEATYGLALRTLVDPFEPARFSRWKKIWFAGFYALTRAEERLIGLLKEHGIAETFWDIDAAYFEDTRQEAGYFLRENPVVRKSDPVNWITRDLETGLRDILIIGTPGRAAQAKVLGDILKKEADPENDTAIVLPDETLLFPVLHSLPETTKHINVTMGYPLKNTSLYRFICALIDLQDGWTGNGEKPFHFRDAARVLLHPYILPMAEGPIREYLKEAAEKNRNVLDRSDLTLFDERVSSLFEHAEGTGPFMSMIRKALKDVVNSLKNDVHFSPEIETIVRFYTQLKRIEDLMTGHGIVMELSTFWNLIREIMGTASVPFVGEPLQGLQIMGLLETRTLDFKNVYILSVNEGVLPKGKSQNSFIPNDVRKAHGMKTWAHEDSIYAYTFYRLLQRAEKVRIFYNTINDPFGKGEKSRFLGQLLHEHAEKYPNSKLGHQIVSVKPVFDPETAISVDKDEEIIRKLKGLTFSPTGLQTYADCSLKFYFQKLCGLKEQKELLETADAAVMGSVIHQVLSRLYQPLRGKAVTEIDLKGMLEHVSQGVREVYDRLMGGGADLEKGRNFLNCHIIETLLGNYIRNERPGKTVLELEKTYTRQIRISGFDVILEGKTDRIEKHLNRIDIIDFKTGRTDSLDFELRKERTRGELIEEFRKKGQVLQLLCYFVLAAEKCGGGPDARFRLSLYSFKDQRDSGSPTFLHSGKDGPLVLGPGDMPAAEAVVIQVLEDLFDKEKPFEQTNDTKACEHCPFAEVCGR
jgi:hypothetical protein